MDQEISNVCKKIKGNFKDIDSKINELQSLLNSSIPNHSHSLLALKNQALASYLLNLLQYMQCRLTSTDITDLNVVKRLLHMRLFLEKSRPLQKKMRYGIEKQLQTARVGQIQEDGSNPLSFRPNLENIDFDDDEVEAKGKGKNVYRPPKLNPVVYDEEDGMSRKEERENEFMRKKIKESEYFKDYKQSLTPWAPDEIETEGSKANKVDATQRFEEANFRRIIRTKKDRVKEDKARLGKFTNNSIFDFSRERDMEALITFGEAKSTRGGRKRKRTKGKKSKFGKKKGKRRKT